MDQEIRSELKKLRNELKEQKLLQKEMLTFQEACKYLDVSSSYLYKKTSQKSIPFYAPSKRKLFFKKHELDNWMFSEEFKSDKSLEKRASDYLIKKGRVM
jgi:excisionase family DNA binding protein